MTTEAQAAVLAAATMNAPGGANAGSARLSAEFATEIQAWFNSGFSTPLSAGVTFTDVGDLVTLTAHGLTNGMIVEFLTIVGTTGIAVNTEYYVISATANTFQVSATSGGAALPLTTDGTGTAVHKLYTSANAILAIQAAAAADADWQTVKQLTTYANQILAVLP